MENNMKILVVSPEVAPFIKTGGLADFAGSLPKALAHLGMDVRVVLPLYKGINRDTFKLKPVEETFSFFFDGQEREVSVKFCKLPRSKVTVYFVEYAPYFDRQGIYREGGQDYEDNFLRFAFFSRAVLEMLPVISFKPDVIHTSDWQTGLVPCYLKVMYKNNDFFRAIGTLHTIHNTAYQGIFPHYIMERIGLPWSIFNHQGVEYWGHVSYMKAGLNYADLLNTVSPTYTQEIQTTEEFGRGLEGLLRYRSEDLIGILNGIDYDVWNPMKDELINSMYDRSDLRGKNRCKKALQKEMNLPLSSVPVIAMISRLIPEKGLDLVLKELDRIMEMDVQMVVLGKGDEKYETALKELAEKYPDKLKVKIAMDIPLSHRIYAGSDIILMPSRFEPCGLTHLIGMKYGVLPVVFHTGGLADTIMDFVKNPDTGNGFVMEEYSGESMMESLRNALELYSVKRKWNALVKSVMALDFSWKKSSVLYQQTYRQVMEKQGLLTV